MRRRMRPQVVTKFARWCLCMHRVNRSVPWKEQAKARLASDLAVRELPERRLGRLSTSQGAKSGFRSCPTACRWKASTSATWKITRPRHDQARSAALDEVVGTGSAARSPLVLSIGPRPCVSQDEVNRCRADQQDFGLDDLVQVEVAVQFHCIDQHRDQRLQALAANPIGRFSQHGQRLTHCIAVEPVPMRAAFAVATPSRSTNSEFWSKKMKTNRARDRRVTRELKF